MHSRMPTHALASTAFGHRVLCHGASDIGFCVIHPFHSFKRYQGHGSLLIWASACSGPEQLGDTHMLKHPAAAHHTHLLPFTKFPRPATAAQSASLTLPPPPCTGLHTLSWRPSHSRIVMVPPAVEAQSRAPTSAAGPSQLHHLCPGALPVLPRD